LSRSKPVSEVSEIAFGNMPNDGGHLTLSDEEKNELLKKEPNLKKYVRPFLGPDEYLYGIPRWCLWLVDASPEELRASPLVMERIENVRNSRLRSSRIATKKLAAMPALFGEIRQPKEKYLAIPKTSSERRSYIPISILDAKVIASTDIFTCPNVKFFHFGVLTSAMHMAWVRQVCGRLESRYRYSAGLVYNNYPWPTSPDKRQMAAVEKAAQKVLAVRQDFPQSTLADLYHPLSMPPALVKAHAELDRAVDLCYRPEPFTSERQRVEYLFGLYERLTAPLLPAAGKKRKKNDGLYFQKLPKGSEPEESAAAAAFHNIMGKEDTVPYKTS